MKKAIIFGANGYLGRHIVQTLNNINIETLSIGNSSKSIDNHNNYSQIDISIEKEVATIDFNVDYIFVFAGLTGTNVGFDKYERFIQVNENGLLNVLNHHKSSKSKARIIFPSTRLVYKGIKNTPLKENSEKEAKTIYAQNKLSCEAFLKMYQNNFNIDYTIFRICVPYGNVIDNNYSYGTIGMFLNKAAKNENITLYGDGDIKRTFTHVSDISQLIIKSLDKEISKNKIYNIGSNDNMSLLEVANLVASKNDIQVNFMEWPEAALKIESGDTIFDDTKVREEINYDYKYSVADWINNI